MLEASFAEIFGGITSLIRELVEINYSQQERSTCSLGRTDTIYYLLYLYSR